MRVYCVCGYVSQDLDSDEQDDLDESAWWEEQAKTVQSDAAAAKQLEDKLARLQQLSTFDAQANEEGAKSSDRTPKRERPSINCKMLTLPTGRSLSRSHSSSRAGSRQMSPASPFVRILPLRPDVLRSST